jgi:hypothetical protein
LVKVFEKRLTLVQDLLVTLKGKFAMKINRVRLSKLTVLSVTVCAVLAVFSQNASAAPHPLPPDAIAVPDGGATLMLLGVALGALGIGRRFLMR